ncbi:MAG: flagellar hook-length control protein FliK [Acidobacteriota bacterium]|nr:flagellar hook-length control protein FliK [Acidobacteriota bacterium]
METTAIPNALHLQSPATFKGQGAVATAAEPFQAHFSRAITKEDPGAAITKPGVQDDNGRVDTSAAGPTISKSAAQSDIKQSSDAGSHKKADAPASNPPSEGTKGKRDSKSQPSATTPVLVAVAKSAATGPANINDEGMTGEKANPANSAPSLSWLMAMVPDALAGNSKLAAKVVQSGAPHAALPSKGLPDEIAPPIAETPSNTAPRDANLPANVKTPASSDSSHASSKDSKPASGDKSVKPAAANEVARATPAQDAAGLQSAAQTLENAGLALLSKTTSADGGALPTALTSKSANTAPPDSAHAPAPVAGASTVAHPQNGSGQDTAKDLSPAAPQPAASQTKTTQSVKPAAAASGDGAKNNLSQDSQPRQANSLASATASSAGTSAGAASPAASTAQSPASAFPTALSQAPSGTAARAGVQAQPTTQQAGMGDKIAAALDGVSGAPKPLVNAASLLQAQGRSEMRVAVQTEGLGAMQLHAVLEGGRLGASIAVVSHEAHTLLNNELPALQQVLTDQNLRIDHLKVISSPMSSGSGSGDGGRFQSGNFGHPQGRDTRWYSPMGSLARTNVDGETTAEISRRLSVRA